MLRPTSELHASHVPSDIPIHVLHSVACRGVIEPIWITPDGTIIDGVVRWAAAIYYNVQVVPVRVIERGIH